MKNLNAKEFGTLLAKLGACGKAREWAQGKDLKTVWETCERGDWLLWLVGNMADKSEWPTRKQVVLAACGCAETALKFVLKDELRPKQCIELTRRWANGDPMVSLDDVRKAAEAARAAGWAADAAGWAAEAAARAAEAAARVAKAARAARAAARAADAAAEAAAEAAALKEYAELVRQELKLEFEQ